MTVHASADPASSLPSFESGLARTGSLGRAAAFYLGMPLLLATPLGWYGAGIASQTSRPVALLLWSVIICVSWWVSDLCTRVLAVVTGSRQRRSPWLLVGGFFINVVLARYHSPAVIAGFLQLGLIEPTPLVVHFFEVDRDLLDLHYLWSLLGTTVPGLVFWLVGNLAFERYCETASLAHATRPQPAAADDRVPLAAAAATTTATATPALAQPTAAPQPSFAPQPASSASPAAAQPSAPCTEAVSPRPAPTADLRAAMQVPRFFQRLSKLAGLTIDDLVAIEAEDHYVQVHSIRGKELIYYRFRDALQELESLPDGLQIHRSAWVSRRHVTALDGRGRKLEVVLDTGDRLGVSLSNRGALLQAGIRLH